MASAVILNALRFSELAACFWPWVVGPCHRFHFQMSRGPRRLLGLKRAGNCAHGIIPPSGCVNLKITLNGMARVSGLAWWMPLTGSRQFHGDVGEKRVSETGRARGVRCSLPHLCK